MSCIVYICCRMTGRSKREQIARAKHVCAVLRQYGITPISPVLEENVPNTPGVLVNDNRERLAGFWARDKEILREEAHVALVDGAHEKSFGVERELGLMRFCLWKPVILLMPNPGLSVATLEDDAITDDLHIAGEFIRHKYGTRWKRWKWRAAMLCRTLPYWIYTQLLAWR